MNLFFKSYHFYLFFFLTFWLKTPLLLGISQSENIPATLEIIPYNVPAAYNQSPTISFCRSEQGITFISKNNHLVVIDDDNVYTHPINSAIHLSCSHHQKPAFLSKNDLGFISYSPFTGTSFESKLENTNITKTFQPVNIAHNSKHTFFATSIGIYTIGSDSLQFHSFQNNPCKVFTAGAETFAHVFSLGIYRWNGAGFEKVIAQSALKLSEITSITSWNNGWVLGSGNKQVFFKKTVNGYTQRKLPPPFINNRINHFRKLNDHTLIYFDQEKSIKIFNRNRQCTQSFHTSITLPNAHPVDILTDQFHDLWLVYDYSVYKLNSPGSSLNINLSAKVPNFIYSAGIHRETIYLGTFNGLFKVGLKSNCQCTLHYPDNTESSMHLITGADSAIFAAGKNGLFALKGAKFQKIRSGSFSFLQLINDNQIVARTGKTLFQLTKTKEQNWRVADSLENVSQISSFTKHSDELWLLTQEDTLISNGADGLVRHPVDFSNVLGEKKLLSYQQALLIASGGRLMKIHTETGDIKLAEDIPNAEYLIKSALLKKTSNHYWIAKNEPGGGYLIYDLQNLQEGAPFFNITADNQFGQLVNIFETKEFIWFAGSQKIIRLLKSPEESIPSKTLRIQSVTDADHNKIAESSRVNYNSNHLYFNLGDIRYKNNPQPYYRYKISHYQEKWSDWSSEKTIEFADLKERKYTFTAQSISHIGHLSDPVSFSFSIAPPFYRTWIAYIIYVLLLLILAFLLYKFHLMNLQRVENRLEEKIRLRLEPVLAEKEKSDKLVEDLLPKTTADELKTSGRAKSKKFELVTVLFSDIQGFTRIAEEMNPEILIDELDKFFFHFDSVVEKYNIEKIKTIGDAYMAAGGIPIKNSSNPVEVVLAGLEMQYYMKELKKQKADIWDLRIGIHTGPVITGVVGHKKLSYDIWGDTVNTASRMESSGEGGKVNISGITYSVVKDYFICEYRGKLPVKYKGNIDMYFVKGLRPELSVDLQRIPNKRFFTKLQMLRLRDLEELVLEKLKSHSDILVFHNKDYLIRMVNQTELLGRSENISDEDLLLVQTSALLMYTGLAENYENYENTSIQYVQEILPFYSYSGKQIDRICNLILATKTPFEPQNLLEKILIDANMEYLGSSDYVANIKLQFEEIQNMGVGKSHANMVRQQEELLKKFNFHTIAAQRLREISKEEQIAKLKTLE